jgi:hypothetical protein
MRSRRRLLVFNINRNVARQFVFHVGPFDAEADNELCRPLGQVEFSLGVVGGFVFGLRLVDGGDFLADDFQTIG